MKCRGECYMSILIGLTGWGDHPAMYEHQTNRTDKLYTYSSHFPVVEVDTSFYAIPSPMQFQKWMNKTPDGFSFVIKAYQGITGQDKKTYTNAEMREMIRQLVDAVQPVQQAGKLNCILLQFPPWFKPTKYSINKLRKIKMWLGSVPAAIEFRNRQWYEPYKEETLDFLKEEHWIHVVCDEPQAGEGSVPIVNQPTHEHVLVRFHGRNIYGWNNNGQENWRKVRFLYLYNEKELEEWKHRILELQQQAKTITVLFNNNSGGDAHDNAKQLMEMLEIQYDFLHPKQIDLFDLF